MESTHRRKRREASFSLAILLAVLCFLAGCAAQNGVIGAMLGKDVHDGSLHVREVAPGMSAAAAGLRDGDEVLSIDGEPVEAMSPIDVDHRLKGRVGTKVLLLLVRNGVTHRVEVLRGPPPASD